MYISGFALIFHVNQMSNVVFLRAQKLFDLFSSAYCNLINFLLSCSQENPKNITHAVNINQNLTIYLVSELCFYGLGL